MGKILIEFDKEVIGSCLLFHKPFYDYTSHCRCSQCRLLVMVCNQCQALSMLNEKKIPAYICELCDKNGHIDDLLKHPKEGNNKSNGLTTTKDDHAAAIEDDSTRTIDELEQKVAQYRLFARMHRI